MLGVSLNHGAGGFSSTTSYSAESPRGLAVADFSRDGNQDIAVLENKQVSIYPNNGNGTFGTPANFSLPQADTEPTEIAVADFDGDGKPDVAVLNDAAGSYQVSFLLSAPATPHLPPIANQDLPYGLAGQISAAAWDPDPNAALTYSATVGTINPQTGEYTSVPITLGMTDQLVTITVSDNDSPPHTASESFTIHPVYDSPVVVVNNHIYYADDFLGSGGLNVTVPVGQPLVLTGYIADSAAEQPLTATVNLNDLVSTGVGTQPLPLNSSNGFTLSHTYTRPRSFQVSIVVTDSKGVNNSPSSM